MSGVVKVNETAAWIPAGWVYDGVLELIARELANEDQELAAALLGARTNNRGYFDLRGIDAAKFHSLLQASQRAYDRAVEKGPGSFHDPRSYDGFIKRFEELRSMLRADHRSQ